MNTTPENVREMLSTFGQGTPRSMATRWLEQEPVQGPALLVSVDDFPWTDDFSWMRELTCVNHPTAKYYTKNLFSRGLHIITLPQGIPMEERTYTGECKCPLRDLVVVVAPGSQEERDVIAARMA